MDNAVLEKMKIAFYDVKNITTLININIIGFILLTIAIFLFISERYFIRKFNNFLNKNTDELNINTSGYYIFYNFIRKLFLYLSLIFISVNILQNSIWSFELDRNISIFNVPMLVGFLLLVIIAVLYSIKFFKEKFGEYILLGILITGYVIYVIGFIIGIKLISL